MMEDSYRGGRFVRRWSLIGGWPACLDDGLDTDTAHPAAVAAALVENARIRALLAAVEQHEAGEDSSDPEVIALAQRRASADPSGTEGDCPAPQRVALVRGQQVVNVIWVDGDWTPPPGDLALPWSPDALPGGTWAAGAFHPPPPPPAPVPEEISLRQLLLALRDAGWISHAEALAAARTGAMPAPLVQLLAVAVAAGQISQAQAGDAELTWAAMYTALRSDPIWQLFALGGIASAEQVDDVFRQGALR